VKGSVDAGGVAPGGGRDDHSSIQSFEAFSLDALAHGTLTADNAKVVRFVIQPATAIIRYQLSRRTVVGIRRCLWRHHVGGRGSRHNCCPADN
jgi:hypothetical protein